MNAVETLGLGVGFAALVPATGDALNISLGLFGFLVPMALAMSAQSLPMYAGLEAFPRGLLWPLAGVYLGGLAAYCAGIVSGGGTLNGLGLLGMGGALLVFIAAFLRMMRTRGKLPKKVAELAPSTEAAQRGYTRQIAKSRDVYGPFVALVASAYMWALLAGLLLVVDGVAGMLGANPPVALDAIRHALAIGFVALLICGISPRMVPGFSGGKIASPRYVTATLWLGNASALLRVGSILLAPVLVGGAGQAVEQLLFGLFRPDRAGAGDLPRAQPLAGADPGPSGELGRLVNRSPATPDRGQSHLLYLLVPSWRSFRARVRGAMPYARLWMAKRGETRRGSGRWRRGWGRARCKARGGLAFGVLVLANVLWAGTVYGGQDRARGARWWS